MSVSSPRIQSNAADVEMTEEIAENYRHLLAEASELSLPKIWPELLRWIISFLEKGHVGN